MWQADCAQTRTSTTGQGCERRHSSGGPQKRLEPGLREMDVGRAAGPHGEAGYPSPPLDLEQSWPVPASVSSTLFSWLEKA